MDELPLVPLHVIDPIGSADVIAPASDRERDDLLARSLSHDTTSDAHDVCVGCLAVRIL